jgi:hypothetical protein
MPPSCQEDFQQRRHLQLKQHRRAGPRLLPTVISAAVGLLVLRWQGQTFSITAPLPSRSSNTLVSIRPQLQTSGNKIACRASGGDISVPILRRDPKFNAMLQRWVNQQKRLFTRESGMREKETEEDALKRKANKLMRLGLKDKAEAVLRQMSEPMPAWHIPHMVEGDVFKGTIEHPAFNRGESTDFMLKMTSATEGLLESTKASFEERVQIKQDFAIPFEKGQERQDAMMSYAFNKFNMNWRRFDVPVPTDMEYLSLDGLRLFFFQVAEVEGFPSESEFQKSVADPAKGMTKAEFKSFVLDEDPEYLEKGFKAIYTGRRVNVIGERMQLDGDFQEDAKGCIFGFGTFDEKDGGQFNIRYVQPLTA